jgi:hypothetical protein
VINEIARVNSGRLVANELVVPPLEDDTSAIPIASSATLAAAEDFSGSDKIFDASQPIAVTDDVVDLIAAGRDGDEDEAANDALDAAFANLL